jgi:hypothetical protein
LEITSVYFGLTDKIPIKYSAFFRYWRKMWMQSGSIPIIYRFREGLWVGEEEVLYNILIEFSTRMKLVRLSKMCLNET